MRSIEVGRISWTLFHPLGDIPLLRLHDLTGLRDGPCMCWWPLHVRLYFISGNVSRLHDLILPHCPAWSLKLRLQLTARDVHSKQVLTVCMHLVRGGVILNAWQFVRQIEGIFEFLSQHILLVLSITLSKESIASDLARFLRIRWFSLTLLIIRPLRKNFLRVCSEKALVMVAPHLTIRHLTFSNYTVRC